MKVDANLLSEGFPVVGYDTVPSLSGGAGYWYLASPYSRYEEGLGAAAWRICIIAGELIRRSVPIYVPIAETHMLAEAAGLDHLDADLWSRFDRPKLEAAAGVLVATMKGWRESHGVTEEIAFMANRGRPVLLLDCSATGF